jgi:CelD/BcsL family acetyltransferase involved in cellulose biosynthesis
MSTSQVRVFSSFSALPENFRDLLRAAGRDNFFTGLEWYENLAATALEAGVSLHIYGLEDGGRALAALVLRSPPSQQGSILRQHQSSARALSSFTNFQSCEFAPAIAAGGGSPKALLAPLFRHLADEKPAWDVIEINSVAIEGGLYEGLTAAMAEAGFVVRRCVHFGNWHEHVSVPSYEEYLKQRDASDRKQFQNYSRKRRKLEKAQTLQVRVVSGQVEDTDRIVADYVQIHAASWKESEAFEEFMPNLLRVAARSGALRMGILYLDGMPVATEVGLLSGKRATMIKTAYDARFREHSVGAIVMMEVLKHLIEVDKVSEIDFGRDDQSYKKLWMPLRRERWGVVAFNPATARGMIALTRVAAQQAARELAAPVKRALRPMVHRLRARFGSARSKQQAAS